MQLIRERREREKAEKRVSIEEFREKWMQEVDRGREAVKAIIE